MRAILILLAAAVLAACAPAPVQPIQAAAQGKVAGFGTLTSFGDWEFQLAPAYTEVKALGHQAAVRFSAGAINLATAKKIQASLDAAQIFLDQSRRGNAKEPTTEQRLLLIEAQFQISEARNLLEIKK
ncbi:MAG: hypothetical protein HZC22_13360 [Rhodocyclales bacterium]|nr:hypothetical protein [Rhodocyclales bacterium]